MTNMHAWIEHWGYTAVLLGTFIEGEMVLLVAGALAHRHALALPWVMAMGCIGSVAWSQLWFRAGRFAGYGLIARRPKLFAQLARVQHALRRYAGGYLLVSRFVAGMGTATPAIFGASGFGARRFTLFDTVGAAAWSAAVSCGGYGVGLGLQQLASAGGS